MKKNSLSLNREDIQKILPHRPPFLMIDRVIEANSERVVAIKDVLADEFFFEGHFPNNPIMPGVLIVEAMAQTCLILYSYNFEIEDLLYLVKEKSHFYHPVYPGDQLRIVAKKIKCLKKMGLATAEAFVDVQKVAESQLGFAAKGGDLF